VNQWAETILWYILLLAIGAGVVFTYGIADDLLRQWHQRKNSKKKTEIESHRAVKPEPVQPAVSAKSVVRGYDSRDLFWEDALLRIREVKQQIAAGVKKGEETFDTAVTILLKKVRLRRYSGSLRAAGVYRRTIRNLHSNRFA
jgi:hypothetical protein